MQTVTREIISAEWFDTEDLSKIQLTPLGIKLYRKLGLMK